MHVLAREVITRPVLGPVPGDEGMQRGGGGIVGDHHPAAAVPSRFPDLDRHADQGLPASGAPAPQPRLLAADEGLVHLGRAGQPVPARSDKDRAQPVQHRPCRRVRANLQPGSAVSTKRLTCRRDGRAEVQLGSGRSPQRPTTLGASPPYVPDPDACRPPRPACHPDVALPARPSQASSSIRVLFRMWGRRDGRAVDHPAPPVRLHLRSPGPRSSLPS